MGPFRAPGARRPAAALAVQRPYAPAGPARGDAGPTARCRRGGARAGARAAAASGAAGPAAGADTAGGGRWPGGAGATGGASSAGSAGQPGLAALFDRAPGGPWALCNEHGRPWRAARRGAGTAVEARLPFPVAAIRNAKPPRGAGLGRFALGSPGARPARALPGFGGHYPRPAWRHPPPRSRGRGHWGAGTPCCALATVM